MKDKVKLYIFQAILILIVVFLHHAVSSGDGTVERV